MRPYGFEYVYVMKMGVIGSGTGSRGGDAAARSWRTRCYAGAGDSECNVQDARCKSQSDNNVI